MDAKKNNAQTACEALWSRAFGGMHAADAPNSSADLKHFRGETLAALSTANKVFLELNSSSHEGPTALFLVGGPGAGKSSAARQLLENFKELEPMNANPLAKRTHFYDGDARPILLVNDATMTHASEQESTISADLDWAAAQFSDIVICVNRGILAEETSLSDASSAQLLISIASESRLPAKDFELIHRGTSYLQLKHSGSGYFKNVVVVYLDAESLFDYAPEDHTTGKEFDDVISAVYDEDAYLLNSPAAKMMDKLFSTLILEKKEESYPSPIAANVDIMANRTLFLNLLKVLRASEMAIGSFMNYRTIWATISRAFFADLPERNTFSNRFESLGGDLSGHSWEAIKKLASLRMHQSLFGVDGGKSHPDTRRAKSSPLKWLNSVDPVFSSIETPEQPDDSDRQPNESWSQPVFDAFFGSSKESTPLGSLRLSLADDDPFIQYISDFDWQVDQAFVKARDSTDNESKRRGFTSWYGQYLLRAYALANGRFGHEPEVAILREFRENSGHVPTLYNFDRSFYSMLRPSRYTEQSGGVALLSIFESRVAPILGDLDEPKLAIRVTDMTVRSRLEGKDSFIVLEERGIEIGAIIVDLPLVHEVMSWSSGMRGITEASRLISPRIERLRAAKLVSGHLERDPNSLVIADQHAEQKINLGLVGR